jgi:FkbM family methyltransferase
MTNRLQLLNWLVKGTHCQLSFSQSGEDRIIEFIFNALGMETPNYLDVGANEAIAFNNTYLFYLKGSRGVLIEPEPSLHMKLLKERPRDVSVCVGIGRTPQDSREFYVMSTPTLNTFSKLDAERLHANGVHRIDRVECYPVKSINQIFNEYFDGKAPDYLSIDVEGLDFEIIDSIDYLRYRPTVICVETLTFSENNSEYKIDEIGVLLKTQGYFLYADTYINSIFVDEKKWKART